MSKFKHGNTVYRIDQTHFGKYTFIGQTKNRQVVIEENDTGNLVQLNECELRKDRIIGELEQKAIEMYTTHYKTLGYSINWDKCTVKNGWMELAKQYVKVDE